MLKRSAFILAILIVIAGGLAIGLGFAWRGFLPATTNHGQPSGLAFAVIGDSEGHADLLREALTRAKSLGAQFVLHTGDISEDGTPENLKQMSDVISQSDLEVTTAVGNHDIRSDSTRQLFASHFNPPNTAFDRDGYRFLILDNADRKVGFSDETLAFAEQDIQAHPDAHYILVFHRPFDLPLSALIGDDETPASRATNERFVTLIDRADVAAVFNGHLHLYLPYSFHGIRSFVTGGGGGEAQSVLGPLGSQEKHFLMVRETDGELRVEVVELE